MTTPTPPSGDPASPEPLGERLPAARITGTEVHYYVLCPRKLWWFVHGLEQEHVDNNQGAENVALGQLLHSESYPAQRRKEVMIDGLLRLDFTDSGVVHEIKKSKGGHKATQFQLLYYLYYLKHVKGIETTGMIDYPSERRCEPIELTPALEAQVASMLDGLQATRRLQHPPLVEKPMTLCKQCSYQDLCWG